MQILCFIEEYFTNPMDRINRTGAAAIQLRSIRDVIINKVLLS